MIVFYRYLLQWYTFIYSMKRTVVAKKIRETHSQPTMVEV